jgi:beta-galactosidase GanA
MPAEMGIFSWTKMEPLANGTAIYVGTAPDQKGMEWLPGKRAAGNSSWLFVWNHSAEKVTVPLQQNGSDLLTGANVNGSVELEPAGVAIIHWKA